MVQVWRAFSWLIPWFLAGALLVLVVGALYWRRETRADRDVDLRGLALSALLAGYMVALMALTLNPSPARFAFPRSLVLNPFATQAIGTPTEVVLNLALFVPFGLLVYRRWPRLGIVRVLALGGATVIVIETLQYILPVGRAASTADVICGVAGTLVGALLARLIWLRIPFARLEGNGTLSEFEGDPADGVVTS